jgi:hypothetical protein
MGHVFGSRRNARWQWRTLHLGPTTRTNGRHVGVGIEQVNSEHWLSSSSAEYFRLCGQRFDCHLMNEVLCTNRIQREMWRVSFCQRLSVELIASHCEKSINRLSFGRCLAYIEEFFTIETDGFGASDSEGTSCLFYGHKTVAECFCWPMSQFASRPSTEPSVIGDRPANDYLDSGIWHGGIVLSLVL